MSGVMKNCDKTQKIVDEYLAKNDIYNHTKTPKFDFRAYSDFILKNDLKPKDITPSILNRFSS